jgi:hypothetical protein
VVRKKVTFSQTQKGGKFSKARGGLPRLVSHGAQLDGLFLGKMAFCGDGPCAQFAVFLKDGQNK